MIRPRRLLVQDWSTWANPVTIKLDEPGLIAVRGYNTQDVGNPNFVGKSSLFNAMYACLHQQHQLAIKKNSLKSLVHDSTHIKFTVDVDDNRIIADMHAANLKVSENGRQLKSHKKRQEHIELLSLLGTTPELWSSTVHINGIAANPLIRGTSAARCSFLEKAFSLDRYTDRYASVGDILSQMKRADQELERVNTELAELGTTINIKEVRAKRDEYKIARDKTARLLAKSNTLLGRIKGLPIKPAKFAQYYKGLVEKLEIKIRDVEAGAELWASFRQAQKQHNQLKATYHDLKEQLREFQQVELVDDAADYAANIQTKLDVCGDQEEYVDVVKKWRNLASGIAKRHKITYNNLEQLRSWSQTWVANIHKDTQSCPVCGGLLKASIDIEELAILSKLIKKLPDTLFNPDDLPNISKLKIALKSYQEKAAIYNKYTSIREKYLEAKNALEKSTLPNTPKIGSDTSLSDLVNQLREASSNLEAAKAWEKIDDQADLNVDILDARVTKLTKLNTKLSDAVSRLDLDLERGELQKEQNVKLTALKEKLEEEIQLRPIYKALHGAYSPNGMRLWLLHELLEALIAGLNANSHASRDSRFYGYKLSRNRDLTLTASNSRGTYDLRFLSGAECSLFVLNFLAVILPMLPSSKRCSMLILDEMDANCSRRSRDLISDIYLPQLLEIVDTIFFITPNSAREYNIAADQEWLVTKKDDVSSLKVG